MGNEQVTQDDQLNDQFLATGRLFHALGNDPRYRRKVLGLIKEASPETPIPELDMVENLRSEVESKIKPTTDEYEKINKRFDSLERHLSRENFRTTYNLSDAELAEVEDLAKNEEIGSGKTAVELWRLRNQVGNPRGTIKRAPEEDEYLKKIHKVNPNNQRALKALAIEESNRVLAEMRNPRGR